MCNHKKTTYKINEHSSHGTSHIEQAINPFFITRAIMMEKKLEKNLCVVIGM